jgi:hypothetical protein
MSIINNAKEIADLIKKMGDIDLYRRIVELEGEIVDLTRAKRDAEAEIERLRYTLKTKEQMSFKKPFYYMVNDPVPYCPKCWEVNHVAVHMDGPIDVMAGPRYDCHNCKTMIIKR